MGKAKSNRLINETSPYLLLHAHNPVDWYPWGDEAFEKSKRENKPIFLSIGYSTCHWCHVMERESFEDETVAEFLNEHFVSIKVDREARPDIDNIYMRVCQAYTGGGGWPTSIFMTCEQRPFFAGTYFPKAYFLNLLGVIYEKWITDKPSLLSLCDEITAALSTPEQFELTNHSAPIQAAVSEFRQTFDSEFGGFGQAPKFPVPNALMLLLKTAPDMAEKTLRQMYKGGIFDHVGYGFSRYSTDRYWLVPHFEKMLYDNAQLVSAYLMAYEISGTNLFRTVAEKTLEYIGRELGSPDGGFFSAQDADSDGVEGKYYVFSPDELIGILGETDGPRFNSYFGITENGNFKGKNIPNLISHDQLDPQIDVLLPKVYAYRKSRTTLRMDNKILTAWNALTTAAYANAYRILGINEYLGTALKTVDFIERELTDGDTVFTGIAGGTRGNTGFLDDYAFYIYALLCLYQATQDQKFQNRANILINKTISEYFDDKNGGFFFSGKSSEKLIFNPKETYDGAIPSGNSVMVYNLSRLAALTQSDTLDSVLTKQAAFMNAAASEHPAGNGFYLYAMLPTKNIVCVLREPADLTKIKIKSDWIFKVTNAPEYPMVHGKTTFYVCSEGTCLPPSNVLPE